VAIVKPTNWKTAFVPKDDKLWKPLAKQLWEIGVSKRTAQLVLRTAVRRVLLSANPTLRINLVDKEARRVALKFAA
jgi:hypothetical protein